MKTKKTKEKTNESPLSDTIKKLQRGPQIVLQKDAGFIIAKTALNKKMTVLDAGTGSGFLATYLAAASGKVITYEKDPRWQKLAKKNFEAAAKAGIKNILLKKGDVLAAKEKASSFDLITFDFGDSWKKKAILKAFRLLKQGGWLVLYYPTTKQVQLAVEELARRFSVIQVDEIIHRRWQPEPLRPETQMLGHTAFLVFARKS